MAFSSIIIFSMVLGCFLGLSLAVENLEDKNKDGVPAVVQKRSLIVKQFGNWNKLGNKPLKEYLKSFRRRREYFGKHELGERSQSMKLMFMGKMPRPLRMSIGKRDLANVKRSLGGPLGWELWK
eukprot:TRINITY_DN7130_c0_g1_i1.p1 TRINITY_DN7130_c0_g1~~TRINITY_DN7130_c0_g1_i1.p1  ORF type:complete len:136 (-),score=27.23 TRINITY_DN7130_c0_g1_i1:122-493(-)